MTHNTDTISPLWDSIHLPEDRLIAHKRASDDGPLLIITCSMHGNEPAGTIAAQQFVNYLDEIGGLYDGEMLVCIGNFEALKQQQRFLDEDLNRRWVNSRVDELLKDGEEAIHFTEDKEIAEILKIISPYFNQVHWRPAIYLDLHTFSAPGGMFAITTYKERNIRLARALKAPLIHGILENLNGTALHFFDKKGFISLGFEGGEHQDWKAVHAIEAAIWSVVTELKMISPEQIKDDHVLSMKLLLEERTRNLPQQVELLYRHTVYPDSEFVMLPGYRNFQKIKSGEHLANDKNGKVCAPCDGYILMPLYQKKGEDGFFIAGDMS